jgi:hypothetical protein
MPEQLPAFVAGETQNPKVRNAVEWYPRRRRFVHGEEEGDQLGLEPASDEGDRLDGRLVQPLGVVEEIEAGLFAN